MLRRDSIVKVLDFGLAKPVLRNADGSLSADDLAQTTPGVVVGSVRYMSPEQARGLAVDERTDVWSLGVVLYEMLTGHAPFDGVTTSDTLAAVIYKEPEQLSHFNPNFPAELQRIVRKALKKERDERYQNIKDFALDLKNLLYEIEHEISAENKTQPLPAFFIDNTSAPNRIHQTSGATTPTQNASIQTSSAEYLVEQVRSHKWQTALASVGIIALLAAIGFGFYRWMDAKPVPAKAAAFEKTQISRLTTDGKVKIPAISPDGKYVAYLSGELGNRSIVVRQVATDSIVTLVQPSSFDFRSINFSPDGNYIYYMQLNRDFTLGTLYQVPTLGGTPKKIAEDVDSSVSFSPDGKRLAFMRNSTKENSNFIFTANADGSNLQPLASSRANGFTSFSAPAWSPDGSKILVGAGKINGGNGGAAGEAIIAEISVADGALKPFGSSKWSFIESLSWFKDNSAILMTAKETDETPLQVWRVDYPGGEVRAVTNDFNNYYGIGLSADGSTAITLRADSVSTLWSFAPATKERIQILPESRNYEGRSGLAETSDNRLVYTRFDGKESHIWAMDADGKNARQLTTQLRHNHSPALSPDNRFVIFVSKEAGLSRIWRMDADGKNPVRLTQNYENQNEFNPQVTADGKAIVFQSFSNDGERDRLMKIPIEGGSPTPLFPEDQIARFMARLSPDGKHIAFVSFDTAADTTAIEKKIRVAEFVNNSIGAVKNSFDHDFINNFSWSPDGKSLTYVSSDGVPNLWKLPIDGGSAEPVTDFKSGNIFNHAWSRDGKRLFVVRGIVNNDLVLIRDAARASDANPFK